MAGRLRSVAPVRCASPPDPHAPPPATWLVPHEGYQAQEMLRLNRTVINVRILCSTLPQKGYQKRELAYAAAAGQAAMAALCLWRGFKDDDDS